MSSQPAAPHAPTGVDGRPPWRVDGKFIQSGVARTCLRGVTYGPFRPNTGGEPFPEDGRLSADLEMIQAMGMAVLRVYDLPSPHLLAEAVRLGLRLVVGIPWTDHVDFLRSRRLRRAALQAVEQAAARLGGHPAVAAFLIGNEVEKTLVRWMGPARTLAFLEQMIAAGRRHAPDRLFSYATYPSTGYLAPRNADFLAVNVFLEGRESLAACLQKLHHLAGDRPLVVTEFGLDHVRHGEAAQAAARAWFEEECARAAVAGWFWFSFTDEWHRGGQDVDGWQFGLVDAARRPRLAAAAVPPSTQPGENLPTVSVVVCTYNGGATLAGCLQSLVKQTRPALEVLVVDDGSTEDIAGIAAAFPTVRYLRQDHAGLSTARNLGMRASRGQVIAYTDDDCLADEEWLARLAVAFQDSRWAACGGPNVPPAPRGEAEAIVAAAPGAPAHVMLDDVEAEHLPGCNLAVRREALEAIGGFREHYRTAGDDVDVCWRLREAGGRLRFVPGAMVWHHRRRTLAAYLRQQTGYGAAEALLRRDHPARFGAVGGARWLGAIYGNAGAASDLHRARLFHGPQGTGLFQGIYQPQCCASGLGLAGLGVVLLAGLALLSGAFWLLAALPAVALLPAWQRWRALPPRPHPLGRHGEVLLFLLCLLQPVVRGWAQLLGMARLGILPDISAAKITPPALPERLRWLRLATVDMSFWSESGIGREAWLATAKSALDASPGTRPSVDDGWQDHDLSWHDGRLGRCECITVTEEHGHNRRLTRVRVVLLLPLWLMPAVFLLIAVRPSAVLMVGLVLLALILRTRRWIRLVAAQSGLHK